MNKEKYEEIFNFSVFDLRNYKKEGKIREALRNRRDMTYGIF